jgi:itaconyl-CoA hydratase
MTTNRHASHVEVEPGIFLESAGLYLEDVEPGEIYEHRPGRTFTAEENMVGSLRAMDQSAMTIDESFRLRSGAGPAEVNPFQIVAVMTGMMTKAFSRVVANLAWKNVVFHGPLRVGETLYAETTVLEKRESNSRPGQGILRLRTTGAAADGRPICTFERLVLVYQRGHGPYAAAGY